MKISLDWINEFVDIKDIEPKDLAERVTMKTAEVEGYEIVKRKLKNVVVGEIVSTSPILAKKGINEVNISCGTELVRTITTASNLEPGTKIAFAQLGASLNNGKYVQVREIAGAENMGKLCTAEDLNLGQQSDDIIRLPPNVIPGSKLSDLISESDIILEIDNKSLTHRPDLWGHYGMAREIAAIYDRPLSSLGLMEVDNDLPELSVTLDIENEKDCKIYCAIRLSDLQVMPSSPKIQSRLLSIGQRPVNNLVDLTNYVMFETGQPLHAFDGAKVSGISVSQLNRKIEYQTLDGKFYELEEKDLVIHDQNQMPIALAGVIGGSNSEVRESTDSILLESANFDGGQVRKTARRLGLHTEASRRFEKQLPPSGAVIALKRLLHLLKTESISYAVDSALTVKGQVRGTGRKIKVPMEFLRNRMGQQISIDQVTGHLQSIGFTAQRESDVLEVLIPDFRSTSDISIPEDILEEVSRLQGFDKIQPELPNVTMKKPYVDPVLAMERKVRHFLSHFYGYQEVQSYNWMNDFMMSQLEIKADNLLILKNPINRSNSKLRNSLFPNLINIGVKNADMYADIKIYELGSVFDQQSERVKLGGLCIHKQGQVDNETSYLMQKGLLAELMNYLKLPCSFSRTDPSEHASYLGSQQIIKSGNESIGRIGLVADRLTDSLMTDSLVIYFELEIEKMVTIDEVDKVYSEIPKHPGSKFDFSLLFPKNLSFADLEKRLKGFRNSHLDQFVYLYKYNGNGVPENMTSYTFRFDLSAADRTLTSQDLELFHQELMNYFEEESILVR